MARKIKTYYDAVAAEPNVETVRQLAENCTPDVLADQIKAASDALLKPMSDVDRAILVTVRKEFRAALALIQAAKES